MPYDKKLHFRWGFIISILIGLYDPRLGLSTGVTVGVSKVLEDYINCSPFDKYNMLATWVGAVIGTCLCMIVQL